LHVHTVSMACLLRIARHQLLHPQGGVARPNSVVLVSDRCAEERHNAVAHHLVDGALVAVDGFHHVLDDRIKEFACLLGIAISHQLHRAFEISEKNRNLLPLTLQGELGGQDLLGQMPGDLGLGSPESRGPVSLAEPNPAFATELLADGILVLAPGTTHAGSLPASRAVNGRIGGESLVPRVAAVNDGKNVGCLVEGV
jgi:hypothetical protein